MDQTEDKATIVRLLAESNAQIKQGTVVDALGWSPAKTDRLVRELDDAGRIERLQTGREALLMVPDDTASPIGGTDEDSEIESPASSTPGYTEPSDSAEATDEDGSETKVYDLDSEETPKKRAETDTADRDLGTNDDGDSLNNNAGPNFCTNCGTNVRAYAAPTFCPGCGASLQPDT